MATHNPVILMNPTDDVQPSATLDAHGDSEAAALARMGKLHKVDGLADLLRNVGVNLSFLEIGTMSASATVTRKFPILRDTTIHAIFFTASALSGTVTCDASVGGTTLLSATGIDEASTDWQKLLLVEGNQNVAAPTTEGTYDKSVSVAVVTAGGSSVTQGQVAILWSFT
jgi:hypothetical protein